MRRSTLLCVAMTVILLVVSTPTRFAEGQTSGVEQITLYAKSLENSTILTASPPIGPGKCSNVSLPITFSLSPVLGENLQLKGSIVYTLILNSTASLSGNVFAWLSELKLTGETTIVPGSNATDVVALNNETQTLILGTLPPVNYQFLPGSTIELTILLKAHSSSKPYLCWGLPANLSATPTVLPTSVKIPAVNPTQAKISVQTAQPRYGANGTIIEGDPNCDCTVTASVVDSIGVDRLSGSLIITFPNGTSTQVRGLAESHYTARYYYNGTLPTGQTLIQLRLLDSDGNSYSWGTYVWCTPFYDVRITAIDAANDPVQAAHLNITDTLGQGAVWFATTNSTGSTTISLPSSKIVGPLNITLNWDTGSFSNETRISYQDEQVVIHPPIYHFGIRPLLDGLIPLPGVSVQLWKGDGLVANGTTGVDGVANFREFNGNYSARVYYLWSESECSLKVNSNGAYNCDIPPPGWLGPYSIIAVVPIVVALVVFFYRRRMRLHPIGFSYFDEVTTGGLPEACLAIIVGNPGSGKSVLLQTLAAKHLETGRPCVYVTNTDFPSKIREHMATLGMPEKIVKSEKFVFIDAYSALSGVATSERFYVASNTDLTSMGLAVTKSLEELGPGVDLYFDSITPMLSALRTSYLADFLQSIAVKTKANGGKLCVVLGTGVGRADLGRFEEAADCMIETHVEETSHGQTRRLRIKKLRGKAYIDKWTAFRIETGKGVVFLVPENASTNSC